ncbi:2-phosphosulfolactate phosphatase [Intrasporangium calvum]|uniref:Probable 2-phosphosulfolactate phosphatase n=1 Tax=Intrasporangium calvum TaxID=53358 RepID=A0ABT5GH38_9MICO|nr:2-phosphosulfolactate phosphatase [Intrasporangium calvum]MDC5697565.1 2-phosphosulfolactate phosphatase [Intrasporangium calvum]
MRDSWSQDDGTIRVEWGPVGAESLVSYAAERGPVVAVVVDVLSFTTTVSVAVESGMTVWPYRWKDDSAVAFARRHDAELALGRRAASTRGGISLSPVSVRDAAGSCERLVLPSPNGSTISALLDGAGAVVAAGSLRNRSAVGAWVVRRLDALAAEAGRQGRVGDPAVIIVPAGERWPNGTLRPAAEDLWGAGAVVDAVVTKLEHRAGPMLLSAEAAVALAAWSWVADRVGPSLEACASGRELVDEGFAEDVRMAAEVDVSRSVPVLVDGAFRLAPTR